MGGCLTTAQQSIMQCNDETKLLDYTNKMNKCNKYNFIAPHRANPKTHAESVEEPATAANCPSISVSILNINDISNPSNQQQQKQPADPNRTDCKFVCVKKFLKTDEWNTLSFGREATILSTLSHPHILSYITSYQDSVAYYLGIEHCNDGTLISYIYNQSHNTEQEYIYNESLIHQILSMLVDCICYAHSLNIVHRNICLENIWVSNGKYKLTGWDDAEIIDSDQDVYNDFVGSNVYYLPPETLQIRHGSALKKIDVFAIGIIAFILSFGSVPFCGVHHMNICNKMKNRQMNWPANKEQYVSQSLLSFIRKLLSPHTYSRPSVEEVKRTRFLSTKAANVCGSGRVKQELLKTIPFKLHCYESSMKVWKVLIANQSLRRRDFELDELIRIFENVLNLNKEVINEMDFEYLLIRMGLNRNEAKQKTKDFFGVMDVSRNGYIKVKTFQMGKRKGMRKIPSQSSQDIEYECMAPTEIVGR